MKRYTAKISYTVDVALSDDGNTQVIADNLMAFGATDITVKVAPWTGKGEHEFVGANVLGLQDRQVCLKCLCTKDKAAEKCPGITV